jgi:hypothetical protein
MAKHASPSKTPTMMTGNAPKHAAPTGNNAELSTGSARPAGTKPVPSVRGGAAKGAAAGPEGAAAGAVVGGMSRLGRGVMHTGKAASGEAGAVLGIMTVTFAVVAVAKLRGDPDINTTHALFGGFVVLFILSGLYKINQKFAIIFALLIMIEAFIEYGPTALSGITSGANSLTGGTQVSTASQIPSPAGTPLANVPNEQQSLADLNNRLSGVTPSPTSSTPSTSGSSSGGIFNSLGTTISNLIHLQ